MSQWSSNSFCKGFSWEENTMKANRVQCQLSRKNRVSNLWCQNIYRGQTALALQTLIHKCGIRPLLLTAQGRLGELSFSSNFLPGYGFERWWRKGVRALFHCCAAVGFSVEARVGCGGFVLKTVLVVQGCFGCVWAVLTHRAEAFCTSSSREEAGNAWAVGSTVPCWPREQI